VCVRVFVCVCVCVCVCLCASPTSALSNQIHLFVCYLFPNHFQVCCGHHENKNRAKSGFLLKKMDSVTVNAVVQTESEACQKKVIEFVVVETKRIVSKNSSVSLTRQICGQRSGMIAASKR